MSESCKSLRLPLIELSPRWVEFTGTRGVLRCLNANDERHRAQGVVFDCPRCREIPDRKHHCIFLFDSAPELARPHGRYIPNSATPDAEKHPRPADFKDLSLWMKVGAIRTDWLRPSDLVCKWDGQLQNGVVSWRPSFAERGIKK